jgi:hypothetical protein
MRAKKGIRVEEYSGNFRNKAKQPTKWMAASEAKFLVPLDVDEFLVLIVDDKFVVGRKQMIDSFRYLPVDGRRYKINKSMLCNVLQKVRQASVLQISRDYRR